MFQSIEKGPKNSLLKKYTSNFYHFLVVIARLANAARLACAVEEIFFGVVCQLSSFTSYEAISFLKIDFAFEAWTLR